MLTYAGAAYIIAAILFVLAATWPLEPLRPRIIAIGLVFLALGHVLP